MQLSDRQQTAAATAVTILSVLVILSALVGVFWLTATFLERFSNVFLPLAVAGVAALVFQPYYEFLHERLRLPTPLALAALFLSVLIPIGAFVAGFGWALQIQISGLIERVPAWWSELNARIAESYPNIQQFLNEDPFGQRVKTALQGQGDNLLAGLQYFGGTTVAAGAGVARWAGDMLSWVVTPVYFAFFLMADRKEASQLEENLPFLKPETRKDAVFLIQEFVNIVVSFFRGQLIIAFLQGLLFAIGFSLIGLRYGLVLGLALGFLNIIPYFGSMLGLGITLPLSYFQEGGGLFLLIGVIVVFLIVQMIEGYVLTPKIMGDRTGLHPMVIIFAIFFWGSALSGILGMILAIPLTAFLVVFWRLAKDKYIDEWV